MGLSLGKFDRSRAHFDQAGLKAGGWQKSQPMGAWRGNNLIV
jgi:hypothetical protein